MTDDLPVDESFGDELDAGLSAVFRQFESKKRSGKPLQDDSSPSDSSSSVYHGQFLPGTKVAGRYRIVSLLGRGGMGEVYRADDLKLGHTVAFNFLPKKLGQNSRLLDLFHNEVRLS